MAADGNVKGLDTDATDHERRNATDTATANALGTATATPPAAAKVAIGRDLTEGFSKKLAVAVAVSVPFLPLTNPWHPCPGF
jgi:hypothetical protein